MLENTLKIDLVQDIDHSLVSQTLLSKLSQFIDHNYAQRGGQNVKDFNGDFVQSVKESS